MIVPMEKIAVIVQEKDASLAIKKLQSLGVLHVEYQNTPQGKEMGFLCEEISLLSEAINILSLPHIKRGMLAEKYEGPGNWRFAVKHIIDSYKRIGQLEEYSQTLLNRVYEWESWGDFDPEAIRSLSNRNIFIKLFQIPLKELKNLPQELFVKKISEKAGLVNCVVVSLKEINLPFKETSLPKMSLNQMQSRINKDSHLIETINKDLQKHAAYLYSFIKTRITLVKELELLRVLKGMGQEGKLVYICGYVPNAALKIIETTAFSQRWGFFSREPEEDETVPTLIRNPRWVELINPVFKLLEIIPGYRELDISPLFLCFLSLFFGMIIGDAGYGTVYFLFTLFLQRKLRNRFSDKLIFYLLYLFSSCAIFWGLLTGTVFGQEWYLEAGFKPLLPVLNDTKFLQAFCFFLGAFHLTLAHAWQAIRKAPSVVALSDLGWICVLWAAFFVAKTLILDVPFPFFGKWLIAGGLGLVIFFSNPKRNIVKTIGAGLGTVALSLMNNFTDVVSYIRLFAIGLAGVAIADTVNTLTASLGNTSVAFFGKILIVFLGHTINIVLGPMSVLVHGIRLNVLEFSSHAGLSWGGVAYKPLKS